MKITNPPSVSPRIPNIMVEISTTTTTFNEQPTCNLHLRRFSRPQPQQRHAYDRAQPATDAAPHHLSLKLRRRR
ncbi:hypothetical protein FHG87_021049 [Trinorchestia longiramus]|nr:hypothetical protein FHG87_021049 [Trinorchestia longiramus]